MDEEAPSRALRRRTPVGPKARLALTSRGAAEATSRAPPRQLGIPAISGAEIDFYEKGPLPERARQLSRCRGEDEERVVCLTFRLCPFASSLRIVAFAKESECEGIGVEDKERDTRPCAPCPLRAAGIA